MVWCEAWTVAANPARFTAAEDIEDDSAVMAALASVSVASTPASPPPRTGFGAVYSRLREMVAIVGGRFQNGERARDLWVLAGQSWRKLDLAASLAPADVESSTYAYRDSRIWLIDDERDRRGHGLKHGRLHARRLYRIDPESGRVETANRLRALDVFDHVWLRTTDDGRVLLIAGRDHPGLFVLALLDSTPFSSDGKVRLRGLAVRPGELVAAPQVLFGNVSGGILRRRRGEPFLSVEEIATLSDLSGRWGALEVDLR